MRRALPPLRSNRSDLVVLGAMLLALAVVLASALASKKVDAATQVTKTFNKPQQILIPAGSFSTCALGPTEGKAAPYPSQLSIGSFPAGTTILDVNLKLRRFTHGTPDDVGVLLSKGDRSRLVMDHVGGQSGVSSPVTNITLTLDDEAANSLPEESQLEGGVFKPTNGFNTIESLSTFDGTNPNSTWKLRVVDHVSGECGDLEDGWSLIIRAKVP